MMISEEFVKVFACLYVFIASGVAKIYKKLYFIKHP